MNLSEAGEVRFESDPGEFRFQQGCRQRIGHLPLAHVHLEPAGFDLGLFLVAEVGDEMDLFFGDDAD